MKVTFKIEENHYSEFYSEDLKLSLEVKDGMATITVVKDEDAVQKASYLTEEKSEGPVVENTEETKLENLYEDTPINDLIRRARIELDKADKYDKKVKEDTKNLSLGLRENADEINALKSKEDRLRKHTDHVAFTHFLHSLIDIPILFNKYKDKEGSTIILSEENGKTFFYDREEGRFLCFNKELKKIFDIPEEEVREKWKEKEKILDEYDEVQEKIKESQNHPDDDSEYFNIKEDRIFINPRFDKNWHAEIEDKWGDALLKSGFGSENFDLNQALNYFNGFGCDENEKDENNEEICECKAEDKSTVTEEEPKIKTGDFGETELGKKWNKTFEMLDSCIGYLDANAILQHP